MKPLTHCLLPPILALAAWGQLPGAPKQSGSTTANKTLASAGHLRLRQEVMKITAEGADSFILPLVCDAGENLYLRTAPDGIQAIHKLNSKGKRVALFQANSPNVRVDAAVAFAVAPDESVYQLIFAHEIARYVFVYDKEGRLKSEVKLQPGFAFSPSKIAVFPNGDLLVAGMEYDKDGSRAMWPFTGIFSPDGAMRREVSLKDDQEIHDMGDSGDPKVVPPDAPSLNYAVVRGVAEAAADGNVYLMRRLSPAIFYAISPGGSVRRFRVDPGRDDVMPESMHVSGNKIAVLFWQPQTYEKIIKVLDLEGHVTATYEEPAPKEGEPSLGLGFACYSQNPERFVFLKTMDDGKLGLITATPE
jgi:hypothetical protein